MKAAALTRARRLAALLADLDRFLRAGFRRGYGMPFNLTQAQYQALTLLGDAPALSLRALGQHLGVTRPTMVQIVDALERKGVVQRARGAPDRRVQWVTLTDAGRHVLQDAVQQHEERLAVVVARLPEQTVAALLQDLPMLLAGWPAKASTTAAAGGQGERAPRRSRQGDGPSVGPLSRAYR
jgi:DNA-binding MarR family transcriptional regulator